MRGYDRFSGDRCDRGSFVLRGRVRWQGVVCIGRPLVEGFFVFLERRRPETFPVLRQSTVLISSARAHVGFSRVPKRSNAYISYTSILLEVLHLLVELAIFMPLPCRSVFCGV